MWMGRCRSKLSAPIIIHLSLPPRSWTDWRVLSWKVVFRYLNHAGEPYVTINLSPHAQTILFIHKIPYSNIIHGRCIHDDNPVRRVQVKERPVPWVLSICICPTPPEEALYNGIRSHFLCACHSARRLRTATAAVGSEALRTAIRRRRFGTHLMSKSNSVSSRSAGPVESGEGARLRLRLLYNNLLCRGRRGTTAVR